MWVSFVPVTSVLQKRHVVGQVVPPPELWFDVAGMIMRLQSSVHRRGRHAKMWLRQLRSLSDTCFVIARTCRPGALAQLPFSFAASVRDAGELISGRLSAGRWSWRVARRCMSPRSWPGHPDLLTGRCCRCSRNARGMLGGSQALSAVMRRGWVTLSPAQAEKDEARVPA
jgi:hypothetical protein